MTIPIGDRAVVLGAGIMGLLAAQVLHDRYREVVVVDRDNLPGTLEPRRAVPQARHAHALLPGGHQVLEQLFPGLTRCLADDGAPVGDLLRDTRIYLGGHRLRQATSGLVVVSASRGFLEGHLRARVRALPRVRLRARTDVAGLHGCRDGRRVTAVRLLPRADHSAEELVDADLVVDATGRTSRAPAWLDRLGIEGPTEERVPIDIAYASRRYRLNPLALDGDLAVLHGLTPTHPRGGVLARIEGGQAILTLAGVLGDRPSTDPDVFDAFARSLQFSDIHDAISRAEPVDDPVPHRFPANTWRHYERLRRLPDGLAVMGDGLCSLNPIYGQGMTVAALEAIALGRHLDRHRNLHAQRFQRELARLVRSPWQMATGADLAFPGVEGTPTRSQRALARYIGRLHATAAHDVGVAAAFVRVSGLVDDPRTLMRPGIAARVLLGAPPRTARRVPAGPAQGHPTSSSRVGSPHERGPRGGA